MKTPSAPAAPDPQKTAQAQTTSNVNTAVANSVIGNANERGPTGSVTYNQIGSTSVGGQDVPRYERVTELSPEQQQLYNQQTKLSGSLNDFSQSQVDRLSTTLNKPFELPGNSQVPESLNTRQLDRLGQAPRQEGQFADVGGVQRSIAPVDDASRQRVEDALYSRLRPQQDRDRAALESKLANQGVMPGSEAYREAIALNDRSNTDARLQTVLAGGQEESRQFGLNQQSGQFANSSQQQAYNQAQDRTSFANQANQQNFANDQAQIADNNRYATNEFDQDRVAAEYAGSARNRQIQEQLTARNQPINEISSLMNGGQVTMPNFAQYQGGNVSPTDVAGINQQAYQNQYQQYQQRLGQQNAMMGGLFGLGGTLLGTGI